MKKYYGENPPKPLNPLRVVVAILITPWALGVIIGLLALLLSGCTEEVEKLIYQDRIVIKPGPTLLQIDTVAECESTDTLGIEIVIKPRANGEQVLDTLLNLRTACTARLTIRTITDVPRVVERNDSLMIVHDTITETRIEQRVIYESFFYVWPGQSAFYIPEDLWPLYNQYNKDALAWGKLLPGGDVVVQRVPVADLPGELWTSYGVELSGSQYVIYLSEELTQDLAYSALYRELTKWQLKKKYSNDVNKIMSPLFDVERLKWSDSDSKKLPYLNTLFL